MIVVGGQYMSQQNINPDFITGRNLPDGDGSVGDEQVNRITDQGKGKPTGQDHSTERHETMAAADGVGAIQDSSDTLSDVADIEDQEGEDESSFNDSYEKRRPRPLNL
jgi:hypothetical protein